MQQSDFLPVARRLETMGVDILREGFAAWVRDGLGFQASDEHMDRALIRVRGVVVEDGAVTMQELTRHIAAEMPRHGPGHSHIDAFGGSAWSMD